MKVLILIIIASICVSAAAHWVMRGLVAEVGAALRGSNPPATLTIGEGPLPQAEGSPVFVIEVSPETREALNTSEQVNNANQQQAAERKPFGTLVCSGSDDDCLATIARYCEEKFGVPLAALSRRGTGQFDYACRISGEELQ